MHGAAEATTAEHRGFPGDSRERGVAIGELRERLDVRAPRGIAEEREVVEVAERLERLHPLFAALGELDGSQREPLALLDGEPAVRVRRGDEEMPAGAPPELVLAQERERGVVVVREQLCQLARPLAARLLDPGGGLRVGAASLRPRQARVRDVADEHVLEHVFPLAGDRRRHPLEHELSAAKRPQRGVEIVDPRETSPARRPRTPAPRLPRVEPLASRPAPAGRAAPG